MKKTDELLKQNSGIRLDIGCGENKQPGFVGMDYRALPGVDIVHNVELFPWPLPDESVVVALCSHLIEHLDPHPGDARIAPLINLLIQKKLISEEEVKSAIGTIDPGPKFMAFMDELWRVMKYDGEVMLSFPYAGSQGFWQDPTHINGINEVTLTYFDPLEPNTNGVLYKIYQPKPWKIKFSAHQQTGNMEVVLIKRRDDPSYHTGAQS